NLLQVASTSCCTAPTPVYNRIAAKVGAYEIWENHADTQISINIIRKSVGGYVPTNANCMPLAVIQVSLAWQGGYGARYSVVNTSTRLKSTVVISRVTMVTI